MLLTTFQVRKVCQCQDCNCFFEIDAEIENEDIVCPNENCVSSNVKIIGSKVRKRRNKKKK